MADLSRTCNSVKRVIHSLLVMLIVSSVKCAFSEPLVELKHLDRDLTNLLQYIENNQLDLAITSSERLKSLYPGSSAVALIYADLRNMLALNSVSMAPSENYSLHMLKILNELKARLKHRQTGPTKLVTPVNLVKVKADTQHVIAVDLSKSRLYLMERQPNSETFTLREHHYVSIGLGGSGKRYEGDLRTPIGLYNINGFKSDDVLPKLYGTGAYTLDYPNLLDTLSGRTGSGIWLHGMPHEQLSRPPQDSEGCVVLQNELIDRLTDLIDPTNTPVLLSNTLKWSHAGAIDQSILPTLETAISAAHSNKVIIEEVLLLPEGSSGTKNRNVYRVRFLLQKYSELDSISEIKIQYWSKNGDVIWSLLNEEA